ncbi:hypothetical protein [Campylobacter jejuni]|uniref:hypothetical protein n=1 Tax=Campylobacter jejuni TaxID=197 RepID=UPI0011A0801E|nr:hypothetical protein [Campylobacter jejuni]
MYIFTLLIFFKFDYVKSSDDFYTFADLKFVAKSLKSICFPWAKDMQTLPTLLRVLFIALVKQYFVIRLIKIGLLAKQFL